MPKVIRLTGERDRILNSERMIPQSSSRRLSRWKAHFSLQLPKPCCRGLAKFQLYREGGWCATAHPKSPPLPQTAVTVHLVHAQP